MFSGDEGLDVGAFKLPKWAIVIGAVGVVFMLLLKRGGSSAEETDTGTTLLAEELNQRLQQQWDRWQNWLEGFAKPG
jgi:hypothetical protein